MPVDEYRVAPHVSMRVNNVPSMPSEGGAHALEIGDAVGRLHSMRLWTDANRVRLCDVLYDAARGASPDLVKRVVLPLKRDIHNDRSTRVSHDDVTRVTNDPGVLRWLAVQEETERLNREIARLHAMQCDEERQALQRTCLDPRFQQALTLSSRSVYRAAVAYGQTPHTRHGSKLRRSESGLLQYAARAATRTSPFSMYTSIAAGVWSESGAQTYPLRLDDDRASSVAVDHALVRRFLDAVVRHETVAPLVAYRLGPGVRMSEDRLTYQINYDDPERQPRMFMASERHASIRRSAVLQAVVGWLSQTPDGMTREALAKRIVRLVDGASSMQATTFVIELEKAGLLVPHVPIPEQCDEILRAAARFLDTIGLPLCGRLAALVRQVEAVVAGIEDAPAADRAVRLTRVDALWREAFAAVGAESPPSVLVYEDSVMPTPIDLHPAPWARVVGDLRRLLPALEVFDFKWYLKAILREEFVARYGRGGRCADLAEFSRLLPRAYDRLLKVWQRDPSETIERNDPCLARILELRTRLTDAFLAGAAAGAEEVTLDPRLVDDIASRVPDPVRRDWASYSAFVQATVKDERVAEVAVNAIYGGLGMFVSRFAESMGSRQVEILRRRIRSFFPNDHLVAEFRPVCGFNANLHPRLAPFELDNGYGATADAIHESDLRIEHDAATDEVLVTHVPSGRRVDLVYVGVLIPYLMPMKYGALYALGGCGQVNIPFHAVAERLPGAAERPPLRRYPRVRFGAAVLCRRRWYTAKAAIPRQDVEESDAAYLARLNHWRILAGIPPTVFLREQPPAGSAERAADGEGWRQRFSWTRSKPQFIDFRRGLFVRYLSRWLRREPDHDVFFEEVLPAFDDAAVRGTPGTRVAEMVIEFDRRASNWVN